MGFDDREAADRVDRVETLLSRVESLAGPETWGVVTELLRALMELYGDGLARVMRRLGDDRDLPADLPARLAADRLVSHLLLLHGLHPLPARTRIESAVREMAPRLGGATVELVEPAAGPTEELTEELTEGPAEGPTEGVVRLRLRPARGGCRSTVERLRADLAEAVRGAAPEVERVEIEEAAPPPAVIPVDSLLRRPPGGRAGAQVS
jgi:hypothetical protein